jgi:hypothetical protein
MPIRKMHGLKQRRLIYKFPVENGAAPVKISSEVVRYQYHALRGHDSQTE